MVEEKEKTSEENFSKKEEKERNFWEGWGVLYS